MSTVNLKNPNNNIVSILNLLSFENLLFMGFHAAKK